MPTEIVVSLISSIIGGLLVALINHLFTRKKTEAETDKLKAEADKIRAETEKMRAEVGGLRTAIDETNYRASATNEIILYDSTHGIDGYDIEGTNPEFKDGVLLFRRLFGRFALRKYIYNGKEKNFLPKNELIAGERKIKISCEAKITQGHCILVLMFLPYPEGSPLETKNVEFNQTDWKEVAVYFRLPPDIDCYLNVFIEPPSVEIAENGSLQLRNLIVAERTN